MENLLKDLDERPATSKRKKSKKSKIKNNLEFTTEEKMLIEKLSAEVEELNHSITATTVSNNTEPNRKKHHKKNSSTSSENTKKQKKIYIEEKEENENNKVKYPTASFIIYKKENENEPTTKRKYKKLKSPFKYNNDINQNAEENIKISENKPRTQKKTKNSLLKKKLKNIILKKLNGKYLKIFYYDKWFRITYDTPNGYEDYEIYNQNEEENKKYQIPNTNYNQGVKINNYTAENEEIEQEEDLEEEKVYKPNDLEEIEERPVDEEESVVASVQGKNVVYGSNAILFSLRKIIKYKNKLYCYFMKWYRGKGKINIHSMEFKKIRKGRKISGGLQKSSNSSTGSNINTPIPEDESEKYTNEKIDVIKKNMKNFILLGGDKNKILKKYYDIWFNKTFKQNQYKSSRNEFIFTYQYQNSSDSNSNTKKNDILKNVNTTFKINNEKDNLKNENDIINEKNNNNEKKNNNINNQTNIKKKTEQIKKNSKEKNKPISKSKIKNKLSNDSTNIRTNPSNNSSLEKKLVKKKKIKKKDIEEKRPSDEYNNIKIRNNNSISDRNSDNNSLNASLPSGSIEMFENSKDSKDFKAKKKTGKKKIIKKEGNGLKVVLLNSDKEDEELEQSSQKKHENENEKLKILEKIKKIIKTHKNNKVQRYLYIKRPKMKKIKNSGTIRKKGSNNINNGIQLEDIQKRFYKLLLKTTCRKDPFMLCFDKWFDYTYNKKDYIPFLRQHRKISESTKRKSSKKTKDKKLEINNNIFNSNSIITKNKTEHKRRESSPLLSNNSYNEDNDKNIDQKKSTKNRSNDDKYRNINADSDGQLSEKDSSYKKHVLGGEDLFTKNVSESWNYSVNNNKVIKKKSKKIKDNNKFHRVQFSMDSKDGDFYSDNNIHCYKDIKINFKSFNNSYCNNIHDFDNKKISQKEIMSYETNNNIYNYGFNKKVTYENLINNYLEKREVNYSRDEEINPDVHDIEIMQEDDTETGENDKKNKSKDSENKSKDSENKSKDSENKSKDSQDKSKDSENKSKDSQNKSKDSQNKLKDSQNEEKDVVKIYKNAMHLLRKAIKSYTKRIKRTFNPDCALKIHFLKWVSNAFDENLEEYRKKRDENIKKQNKINALKKILEMFNENQNKKLIKHGLNKWFENITISNFIQLDVNTNNENQMSNKENVSVEDCRSIDYKKPKKIIIDEMISNNSDTKKSKKKISKPNIPNININKLRSIKSQEDIVLNRSSSYPVQKTITLPKIKIKKKKVMELEGEGLLDITDIEDSSERKKQSKKKHKKIISSNNKEKNTRDPSKKEKIKKRSENLKVISDKNKKNLNNKKKDNDVDKNELEQLRQELSLNIETPNLNSEKIDNIDNKNNEELIEKENKIQNPSKILIIDDEMENELNNQKSSICNISIDEKKQISQSENEEKNEKASPSRILLIKELLKKDKLKYCKNYSLKNIYNKNDKPYKNPKTIEKFVSVIENYRKILLERLKKFIFNSLYNMICGNKNNEVENNSTTSEKIIKNNEPENNNNFMEKNDSDEKTEITDNKITKKSKIVNGNRNIYVSKKKKIACDSSNNDDEMKSDTEENEQNIINNKKNTKIPKKDKQSDNKIYKSQKSNFIKISKLNDSINKLQNVTLNNLKIYNFVNKKTKINNYDPYIKVLKEHNKKMQVYHMYYLYMLFHDNIDFYLKRRIFNKWRINNKVFEKPILKRHIKSILVKNLLKKDNRYKCFCSENDLCLNCDCMHLQVKLKKILIRHVFMKLANPTRFYFYLWYKKTFWKVLPIYLYENE